LVFILTDINGDHTITANQASLKELGTMSFNKIIIVGNLGREPELRFTPQGTPVCNFTLATNEKRKDRSGELQDLTSWFRITLWGRQAEAASQYLSKGRLVYVEGRLRVEEWVDKDDRQRYSLEVHATDMQFIGAKVVDTSPKSLQANTSQEGAGVSGQRVDDDIPF
jgi:single-strand DNA-binding protein